MVISRAILVNCWPFLASVRAFLCLIDDHLECPDMFSPSRSLAQLHAHDSVSSASQNPAVLRRHFLFCRAHRLVVDGDPILTGQPSGLTLAAGEPGLDKELGNCALTRRDQQLPGPGVAKRPTLVPVVFRRRPRMELPDEALSEPLLDVFRVRTVAKSPCLLSDLGRGGIRR